MNIITFYPQFPALLSPVVGPTVPELRNTTVISKYSGIAHVATMVNH